MKVFGGHGLFPSCGDQPRKEAASFQLCTTGQCSVFKYSTEYSAVQCSTVQCIAVWLIAVQQLSAVNYNWHILFIS